MQKHKLKRNIQKGLSIVAAGTIMLAATGCDKKESEAPTLPGIVVTDEYSKDEVRYEYVINTAYSNDETSKTYYQDRPVMFMKTISEEIDSTELEIVSWDGPMPSWWSPDNLLKSAFFGVWPECYKHYTTNDFKYNNSEITLNTKTLENFYGETCILRTITINIIKDMPTKIYGENIKDFKAGDVISATILTADDRILAFSQTGAGSECTNVQKAICGEGTLKTVNEAGVLEDTNETTMTKSEIYDLETSLNNEYFSNISLTLN